jgi:hypothetical protein
LFIAAATAAAAKKYRSISNIAVYTRWKQSPKMLTTRAVGRVNEESIFSSDYTGAIEIEVTQYFNEMNVRSINRANTATANGWLAG